MTVRIYDNKNFGGHAMNITNTATPQFQRADLRHLKFEVKSTKKKCSKKKGCRTTTRVKHKPVNDHIKSIEVRKERSIAETVDSWTGQI